MALRSLRLLQFRLTYRPLVPSWGDSNCAQPAHRLVDPPTGQLISSEEALFNTDIAACPLTQLGHPHDLCVCQPFPSMCSCPSEKSRPIQNPGKCMYWALINITNRNGTERPFFYAIATMLRGTSIACDSQIRISSLQLGSTTTKYLTTRNTGTEMIMDTLRTVSSLYYVLTEFVLASRTAFQGVKCLDPTA
jgi:hypothetical protein